MTLALSRPVQSWTISADVAVLQPLLGVVAGASIDGVNRVVVAVVVVCGNTNCCVGNRWMLVAGAVIAVVAVVMCGWLLRVMLLWLIAGAVVAVG